MMEKSSRPQRNRRHSRRAWPPEDDIHQPRPAKRLFTPEIKRMLKDWLVRRRENPYPSRDEKKRLAIETGLTYTQICNWFANWRRKLKNSERERVKKSWGHLIKNYNTNARGNVEQFSISSEDSIWEEEEQQGELRQSDDEGSSSADNAKISYGNRPYNESAYKPNYYVEAPNVEHSNCYLPGDGNYTALQFCRTSFITRESHNQSNVNINPGHKTYAPSSNKAKYKHKMMEKYLREEEVEEFKQTVNTNTVTAIDTTTGGQYTKWLESAAKFTPNKNNYFVEWNDRRHKFNHSHRSKETRQLTAYPQPNPTSIQHSPQEQTAYSAIHHKDELDAAEALANLAFNCRQRLLEPSPNAFAPINAITS